MIARERTREREINRELERDVLIVSKYRKSPKVSPVLTFGQSTFLGLTFGGAYFRRGLLSDGSFAYLLKVIFQMQILLII